MRMMPRVYEWPKNLSRSENETRDCRAGVFVRVITTVPPASD